MPPRELLWRHVAGRAHHDAGLRRAGVVHRRRPHVAREPEVEQLDAVAREKDVRRLQIAVHEAALVHDRERLEDRRGVPLRLVERQRSAGQAIRERLAVQQLQDQVLDACLVADVVQDADVRVIQRSDRARLALESLSPDADRRKGPTAAP